MGYWTTKRLKRELEYHGAKGFKKAVEDGYYGKDAPPQRLLARMKKAPSRPLPPPPPRKDSIPEPPPSDAGELLEME